jgi:hypothetical protein
MKANKAKAKMNRKKLVDKKRMYSYSGDEHDHY